VNILSETARKDLYNGCRNTSIIFSASGSCAVVFKSTKSFVTEQFYYFAPGRLPDSHVNHISHKDRRLMERVTIDSSGFISERNLEFGKEDLTGEL
jgi:hypothetical protein